MIGQTLKSEDENEYTLKALWSDRGGAAEVYVADAKWARRKGPAVVAIKLARDGRANDLMDRERSALRRLSPHPGIVRFYDSGSVNGRTYLVLEFCESGSLLDFLKQHRVDVTPQGWSALAVELAETLEILQYDAQLAHNDIKAENFLVRGRRGSVQVILADFGGANTIGDQPRAYSPRTDPNPVIRTTGGTDVRTLAAAILILAFGDPEADLGSPRALEAFDRRLRGALQAALDRQVKGAAEFARRIRKPQREIPLNGQLYLSTVLLEHRLSLQPGVLWTAAPDTRRGALTFFYVSRSNLAADDLRVSPFRRYLNSVVSAGIAADAARPKRRGHGNDASIGPLDVFDCILRLGPLADGPDPGVSYEESGPLAQKLRDHVAAVPSPLRGDFAAELTQLALQKNPDSLVLRQAAQLLGLSVDASHAGTSTEVSDK